MKEENKIRVVIRQPFSVMKVADIEKGHSSLQRLVGGLIDCFEMPGRTDIDFVFGDESKIGDAVIPNIYVPEYNDILCGPLVAVGNDFNGNHVGLTDEQIEAVENYIEKTKVADPIELIIAIEFGSRNLKRFNDNTMGAEREL